MLQWYLNGGLGCPCAWEYFPVGPASYCLSSATGSAQSLSSCHLVTLFGLKPSRLAACRIAAAETASPTSSPPSPLQHTLCVKQAAKWRWVLTPPGCSSPVRQSGTFLSSMGVCFSECENCLLRSFPVWWEGYVLVLHIASNTTPRKCYHGSYLRRKRQQQTLFLSFTKEEFILALEISEIKFTDIFLEIVMHFCPGLTRRITCAMNEKVWMRKFACVLQHQVLLTVRQRERYHGLVFFSCSAFHQEE